MTNSPRFGCQEVVTQAYREAQSLYGTLDLSIDTYFTHLASIIQKYLGQSPKKMEARNFLGKTHTTDLYLTIACAQGNTDGWEQFFKLYRSFVFGLAKHFCSNESVGDDLADSLLSDLFMPDRSNRPRIASYDGQSSLATWLRVIVAHRASDERKLKWNSVERLDDLPDLSDLDSLERMDASARASKYRLMILNTLRGASRGLTDRERYILLMIYGESLKTKEVARLLDIHPSMVSKHLRQIHRKIRQEVVSILAEKYQLSEEAIKECLDDIVENPEHSLLGLLKTD
ncbi:MAG: sigma-70 family RNA polymerase sigma factor [Acidobacteriota bacterium]